MQLTQRYYVGKLGISAATMDQTMELLDRQVRSQTSAYVCAANLEAAALAQRGSVLTGFRIAHGQPCSMLMGIGTAYEGF